MTDPEPDPSPDTGVPEPAVPDDAPRAGGGDAEQAGPDSAQGGPEDAGGRPEPSLRAALEAARIGVGEPGDTVTLAQVLERPTGEAVALPRGLSAEYPAAR